MRTFHKPLTLKRPVLHKDTEVSGDGDERYLTSDDKKKEESQCEQDLCPTSPLEHNLFYELAYGPRSPRRCQCLCLRKLDEMCKSLEDVKRKLEELKQVTVEREQEEVTGGKQRRSKRLEQPQPYER